MGESSEQPEIYLLGEGNSDEYSHYYFTSKEKALAFLEKNQPHGWHGVLSKYDIEKLELDPQ